MLTQAGFQRKLTHTEYQHNLTHVGYPVAINNDWG